MDNQDTANPIIFTFAAIVVTSFVIYKLIRLRQQIKLLKLGRDGERAAGQYLRALREKGFRVFHDIVGSGFNNDHVIL